MKTFNINRGHYARGFPSQNHSVFHYEEILFLPISFLRILILGKKLGKHWCMIFYKVIDFFLKRLWSHCDKSKVRVMFCFYIIIQYRFSWHSSLLSLFQNSLNKCTLRVPKTRNMSFFSRVIFARLLRSRRSENRLTNSGMKSKLKARLS